MPEQKQYTQDQAHRFFAVEFNNTIFGLAEKEQRRQRLPFQHSRHLFPLMKP